MHLDFETRSTVDLKEVGLWNYARHPSTSIWCAAYALGDEEPKLIEDFTDVPAELVDAVRSGETVHAFQANFELEIWNAILVPRFALPPLSPVQLDCSMVRCLAMALPASLEDAALALGVEQKKDAEGRALMLRMARPRQHEADGYVTWWDDPERRARLGEYCKQDVRVERAISKRTLPLIPKERAVWLMDHRINARGMRVDVESARAAVAVAEKTKEMCAAALAQLTGGAVTSVDALQALKEWLARRGFPTDSLAKEAIITMLAQELPADVRKALLLRQEAGKTSTAKFKKMANMADPEQRIHYAMQYHAASTGRWGGRDVQPHNMVRDVPKPHVVEEILALARAGDVERIDFFHGAPITALSRCMRAMIVPAPGKVLVGGDYSAIEGRGTAWIAGEEWKLDAFRAADAGTGPGIYELSYAKAFGVPVESVKNPSRERQVGKVQELAFGYQGGAGAWMNMAKGYGLKTTPEEGERNKEKWRAAHPRTKAAWYTLQDTAIAAMLSPGKVTMTPPPMQPVKFRYVGDFLWCLLPSGRALCYPYPKLLAGDRGWYLTYMAVPNPAKPEKTIADEANSSGWARIGIYGGMWMENIVQGICRDLLTDAMLTLEAAGFSLVLHVHDDANAEEERDRAEEMTRIMGRVPSWAKGFPVAITCHVMKRYGEK